MSNLKAIAALDAAILTLAEVRDEIQKRHDETMAELARAQAETLSHQAGRLSDAINSFGAWSGQSVGKLFQ